MFRKNLIDEDEMEQEMGEINNELLSLQVQREQVIDREQALERIQNETVNVKAVLERLRDKLDDASDQTMRDIFQVLVEKITVKTVVEEGEKVPQVTIVYRFDEPAPISEYETDRRRVFCP
jgi:hypothetical protein